jgi:hypothetical protein
MHNGLTVEDSFMFPRCTHLLCFSSEPTMSVDKPWILLLAVTAGAAAGAAFALRSRRRHHRAAHEVQHKANLKTWENEGGNLAPTAVSPEQP